MEQNWKKSILISMMCQGNKDITKKKRSSIEEDNGRLGYHYDALNRLKCVLYKAKI